MKERRVGTRDSSMSQQGASATIPAIPLGGRLHAGFHPLGGRLPACFHPLGEPPLELAPT